MSMRRAAFLPVAACTLLGLMLVPGAGFANDWAGYSWGPVYGGSGFWQFYQPYVYPENGQSPQQQAQDWQACEQWATEQAFASGVPLGEAHRSPDYRQALVACFANRGYRAGFHIIS
jgi:hypothetical protein